MLLVGGIQEVAHMSLQRGMMVGYCHLQSPAFCGAFECLFVTFFEAWIISREVREVPLADI
jgi:hypothetical protein